MYSLRQLLSLFFGLLRPSPRNKLNELIAEAGPLLRRLHAGFAPPRWASTLRTQDEHPKKEGRTKGGRSQSGRNTTIPEYKGSGSCGKEEEGTGCTRPCTQCPEGSSDPSGRRWRLGDEFQHQHRQEARARSAGPKRGDTAAAPRCSPSSKYADAVDHDIHGREWEHRIAGPAKPRRGTTSTRSCPSARAKSR